MGFDGANFAMNEGRKGSYDTCFLYYFIYFHDFITLFVNFRMTIIINSKLFAVQVHLNIEEIVVTRETCVPFDTPYQLTRATNKTTSLILKHTVAIQNPLGTKNYVW